mgnify:CR=1 FL=1
MNLAISNIAWPVEQDAAVAALLEREGVRAIEIAPTKLWPAPLEASAAEVSAYRRSWESRGMRIVAAQSLLFGQPDLTIFADEATRARTLSYLDAIVKLCADLGAEALVFGSPKNRRRDGLAADLAAPIAVDFFGRLGELATRHGTTVVMEANPPQYGADFVTRAAEALTLVEQVNCFGFQLHLDTACMTLAEDAVEEVITAGAARLHHFHVSEPNLAPIGHGGVDHALFARTLRSVGYDRWCSLEMRMVEPFAVADLEAAVRFAKRYYGSPDFASA